MGEGGKALSGEPGDQVERTRSSCDESVFFWVRTQRKFSFVGAGGSQVPEKAP